MSSFGALTFALGYQYQRMAYALALTLKPYSIPLTVIVHRDDVNKGLFKKLENVAAIKVITGRHGKFSYEAMAYDLSPYDVTIKMDADMIVPAEAQFTKFFKFTEQWELVTGVAVTLSSTPNMSSPYRRAEALHDLPLIYSACFGFTKCDKSEMFFKKVAWLFHSWYRLESFSKDMPPTTDSIYSIAWASFSFPMSEQLGLPFLHMKQDVAGRRIPPKWMDKLPFSIDKELRLRVNSHQVRYPFHYYDKRFLTDSLLERLEHNVCDFQSSDW